MRLAWVVLLALAGCSKLSHRAPAELTVIAVSAGVHGDTRCPGQIPYTLDSDDGSQIFLYCMPIKGTP